MLLKRNSFYYPLLLITFWLLPPICYLFYEIRKGNYETNKKNVIVKLVIIATIFFGLFVSALSVKEKKYAVYYEKIMRDKNQIIIAYNSDGNYTNEYAFTFEDGGFTYFEANRKWTRNSVLDYSMKSLKKYNGATLDFDFQFATNAYNAWVNGNRVTVDDDGVSFYILSPNNYFFLGPTWQYFYFFFGDVILPKANEDGSYRVRIKEHEHVLDSKLPPIHDDLQLTSSVSTYYGKLVFLNDPFKNISTQKSIQISQKNEPNTETNQGQIRYFVSTNKTYFHDDADENTKRNAYLERSQIVFGCCEKNGFVNCQFTNEKGKVTSGWIKINELSTDYYVTKNDNNLTKAYVSLQDSSIYLTSNIRQDHRIFGYSKPDTTSEKLLLLSAFTNEVENNPFHCKLGSYYDTNGMDNMTLKFLSISGEFVKAMASDQLNNETILYFEKKWIEIDN